jgi:hypothetical protein
MQTTPIGVSSLQNPPDTASVRADSPYVENFVIIPLSIPAGLSAVANSSSQVTLAWTDTSSSEEGFRIERKGLTASISK